jgi:hypothetical protein
MPHSSHVIGGSIAKDHALALRRPAVLVMA